MAKKPTVADAQLILKLYDLAPRSGDAQSPPLVGNGFLPAKRR